MTKEPETFYCETAEAKVTAFTCETRQKHALNNKPSQLGLLYASCKVCDWETHLKKAS